MWGGEEGFEINNLYIYFQNRRLKFDLDRDYYKKRGYVCVFL